MNKIFTLLSMGLLCLASNKSSAQFTHNLDPASTISDLSANCWTMKGVSWTNDPKFAINTGSLEISTMSNDTASLTTPYLTPTSTSFTIAFDYKLANKLSTMSTRKINIYVVDINNVQVLVKEISLISTSVRGVQSLNETVNLPDLEKKRVLIEYSGKGDNDNNLIIDNLSMSAKSASSCTSGAITLPIKLLSFSGSITNEKVHLQWNVEENETGNFFRVQKSTDGRNFTTAALIFTTTKTGMDSYQFTDADAISAATYYRLVIVNNNNSIAYSKVVVMKNQQAGHDKQITLFQNPIQSNTLNFSFTSSVNEATEVAIYNMAGVKVQSTKMQAKIGTNALSLDLNGKVIKGDYILALQNSYGNKTAKFLKF